MHTITLVHWESAGPSPAAIVNGYATVYICLCKAVTESQIRDAVEAGAGSMRDLARELGVATQCGKCGCDARELLKYCLDELPEHVIAA